MLDQQGQSIASDFSSQYELSREPVATNNAARIQADMEKLQQGTDFRAYGNEPSWSLEIDFDKVMQFKPGEGSVFGHDGCNQFFGKVENQGNQLKFSAMGSTKMACPNMEKSDQLMALLSDQTLTYTVEPRQLVLKQGEEVVLKLKNVD